MTEPQGEQSGGGSGGWPARRFPLSLIELGRRYLLTGDQVTQLATYAAGLAFDEHAPTTVREPRAVLDDHLADALVALELPEVRDAGRIADLGAGAGLPGLPLAVALPVARVTLLEGNARKCAFIERAAAAAGVENVEVIHGRAETWREGIESCDVVTVRAVASLDVVEEYAAPLLRLGGVLVAWRGTRNALDEAAGDRAAKVLGLEADEPLPVRPYAQAEHRHLHVVRKVAPTPDRFPRRDGVAGKRPLGGR